MNENTNKIATSKLNNVLSGVGMFILGVPLAVVPFWLGIMSDFGPPRETLVKRILLATLMVVIGYGIAGFILGKIKPAMSWKSGLILALPPILCGIFLIALIVFVPIFEPAVLVFTGPVRTDSFLIFLPIITAVVVSTLSSYSGSLNRKI